MPTPIEESICSFKSKSPVCTADNVLDSGASSGGRASESKCAAIGSKSDRGLVPQSLVESHYGAGFNTSDDDHDVSYLIFTSCYQLMGKINLLYIFTI